MNKVIFLVMLALAGLGMAGLAGCASMSKSLGTISRAPFGKTTNGTPVEIYTLRNSHGMEARIMTYGGILVSLKVPDKNGKLDDVVLGYDSLDGYLKSSPYFGALIGRYGNRIAGGKFTLEGKAYTLATNNGPNSLHGGIKGFDKVVWKATSLLAADGPALAAQLPQQGWRGRLSGQPERHRGLYPDG